MRAEPHVPADRRPTPPRALDALDARLAAGIDLLGLYVDQPTRRRLFDFLALLSKWNAVYNLTAVRGAADMLVVHLLDALSIVPLVDATGGQRVLDVGSGAGLPAIPLAIVRPTLSITSIDAVAKKIAFQRQAKSALHLSGLTPVHRRIEDAALDAPDVVVARAYADLPTMLASIAHLAGVNTTVLAMKGVTPRAEMDALPAAWAIADVVPLDVPFLGAERCAVVIRRAATARSG